MHQNDQMGAAREVARRVVREQFPELNGVEPHVAERRSSPLHAADIQRLGYDAGTPSSSTAEYTFVFAHEIRTAEGLVTPQIARITVDSQQHVVKAVVSK